MRLLFLTDRFPPDIGGIAVSAGRRSGHLGALGHEVTVVALAADHPPGQAESQYSEMHRKVYRLGPHADEEQTLTWVVRFVERLHRRSGFEAVWGHSLYRAGFLAAWTGRHLGIPSVLSLCGEDFDRAFYPPGDFSRLQWCLHAAARVTAVSADLAARARLVAGKDVTVVPNAVDAATYDPGPRPHELVLRYGLSDSDVVIGFSGELRHGKGMAPLLEAFQHAQGLCRCRLLLIGDVNPQDRGDFVRLAAKLPRQGREILRAGPFSEARLIARHLRLCDVILLPSLRDGLPNSLLEAMACERPVIASTAGGIPEVIRDGHNGLLVAVTHLHGLKKRLEEVLGWPADRRRQLGAAARATVLEHFTPDRERQGLEALLAGLG